MTASKASEGEITIGVGDGSGQLFVHGDFDSIAAVRNIILRLEGYASRCAQLETAVQKAEVRAAEAERERDEARTHGMRLLISDKTTRFCAYCQTVVSGDNSFEEIQDHIKQCTKHPMTVAIKRAETAEAQAVAAELDAGRYRWLRSNVEQGGDLPRDMLLVYQGPTSDHSLLAEELDSAIDAALRRSAP